MPIFFFLALVTLLQARVRKPVADVRPLGDDKMIVSQRGHELWARRHHQRASS